MLFANGNRGQISVDRREIAGTEIQFGVTVAQRLVAGGSGAARASFAAPVDQRILDGVAGTSGPLQITAVLAQQLSRRL